jgi:uncharacterized protein (DUF486 family)
MTSPFLLTPVLLIGSNGLTISAWYGHLKQPAWPIWLYVAGRALALEFRRCRALPFGGGSIHFPAG